MSAIRRTAAFGLIAVLATGATRAGAQEARLTIVSPTATDYVSDRVAIQVRVEPPEAAAGVSEYVYYVDGKEVCRTAARSACSARSRRPAITACDATAAMWFAPSAMRPCRSRSKPGLNGSWAGVDTGNLRGANGKARSMRQDACRGKPRARGGCGCARAARR